MKLTTWNGEWLDTDWGVVIDKYTPGQKLFPHKAPSKAKARNRIKAISTFIENLGADILFLCEAPKGEAEMEEFAKKVTPDYELVKRLAGDGYETGGRQWQWFLVRKALADQIAPSLVPIPIWRSFAATQDQSISEDGTWKVAAPRLKKVGDVEDVPVASRVKHEFYRVPQILRFTYGGPSTKLSVHTSRASSQVENRALVVIMKAWKIIWIQARRSEPILPSRTKHV